MTFWFPSKIVWMLRIPRPADLSTPSRLLSASHSVNSKYCQQRVLTFPPRNTHGPWPWLFGFCSLKMTSNVPFKTMSCRLCGAGHQCPPTATRKKVLTWGGGWSNGWSIPSPQMQATPVLTLEVLAKGKELLVPAACGPFPALFRWLTGRAGVTTTKKAGWWCMFAYTDTDKLFTQASLVDLQDTAD